jgi:hypothetical protein
VGDRDEGGKGRERVDISGLREVDEEEMEYIGSYLLYLILAGRKHHGTPWVGGIPRHDVEGGKLQRGHRAWGLQNTICGRWVHSETF